MEKYGYHGKLLYVNLTTGKTVEKMPDETFYRKYMGGSLMAVTLLLKETAAGVNPFDPRNPIMFFNGIAGGLDAPGLARFVICGKSPVTEGIGEARCEGAFAVALKKTGYDGIIIYGACSKPSFLVLDDGKISIKSADDLWGKCVSESEAILQEYYPGSNTAIIGPAGENLVRFANIICDKSHQASRAGMGAVMGAKKLKAVVLRGGSLPPIADPAGLEKMKACFEEKMYNNTLSMWQHDRPGFGAWIHTHGIDAALSVNNYQTSYCDYTNEYTPEKFAKYYIGELPCPSCPNNCIKCYATNDDNKACGGLHQEAVGALGPNLGNADLKKIIHANVLCNEYGMDPNSLGYTISFAQECMQNGILESDGLDWSFSGAIDLEQIIVEIALRQGHGDLLAEGSYRAAQTIGNGAEKYSMTVKKNEMTPIECRSQTNLALGFATAAVGPRYDICEHDWDFDEVGWDHTLNYCLTLGILKRVPMQYLGKEKVHNYKVLNDLWGAVEILGLCPFATAPTRVYSLAEIAELLHYVTGFETSSFEIMRLGNMKHQIFRCYNLREGITTEQDQLPERFFEKEIDAGKLQGTKLDREKFEEIILFYYQMMGWDEKGIPTDATLADLGLGWLIGNFI